MKNKNGSFLERLSTEQLFVGGVVLISLVIIGVIAYITTQDDGMYDVNVEGIRFYPVGDASHVAGAVQYEQTPPVGGPHNAAWQTCGVYDAPLINEHAIHSLEHGAVWITYQPGLASDQVDKLAGITRRGSHRLLSPYPGIDSPIILSAWGVQLKVENADDPRIMDFIRNYEQGRQTPEPGASCSGGVTSTAINIQ